MASPIRYLSGLIGDWGRDWGRRNLMGEGMANRMNMYDDIVYGEPVISKKFP